MRETTVPSGLRVWVDGKLGTVWGEGHGPLKGQLLVVLDTGEVKFVVLATEREGQAAA